MNVTTVLPFIISGETWRPDFTLFVIGRFFLVYAICILFDYRDSEHDRSAGIRSLITYLSGKGIFYLFYFSLAVFFFTTVALYWFDLPITVISILLIPGVITAFLYKKATRHFSDFFYYFILDGLMALSALVMLIPGNWLTLPSK
jgi:1,4-dihydroxy-2-naphthoate octaprenyltransferase